MSKKWGPLQSPPLFLFTAGLNGQLELCGCRLNQAGGASRRFTFFKDQKAPIIDLGGFLPRPKIGTLSLAELLEIDTQINVMEKSGYSAIVAGPNELPYLDRIRTTSLAGIVSANTRQLLPYTNARLGPHNVTIVGWNDPPPLIRFESRSWLRMQRQGVQFGTDQLFGLLDTLRDRKVVIAGHIHPLTIEEVVRRYDNVRAILSTYDKIAIDVPRVGRHAGRFVLFDPGDEGATIGQAFGAESGESIVGRVSRTMMDSKIPDNRQVRSLLDVFFMSEKYRQATSAEIQDSGLVAAPAVVVDIKGSQYVGSQPCSACHPKEYAHWKTTGHSGAMKTLVTKHRNHAPACVVCHVVGFNQPSGYSLNKPVERLEHVGCEVCHGAGSRHIQNPSSENIKLSVSRDVCTSCHMIEHSAFNQAPDQYWKRILHKKAP